MRRARATVLLLALAAAAALGFADMRLEEAPVREPAADLLYLPSGKYLVVASLGHRQVLADLIYLWAIQYYGNYEITNRYLYLDKIFREVITELDPRYIDPYWIGALIMTIEAKDVEMGLRLLDKGMAANPDQWILPYLAGWECYHAKEYERAAAYFDRATAIPGAPPVIKRAYAGMFQKLGDREAAIAAWSEVARDPSMDARGRQVAEKRVKELRVEGDLERIQTAIDHYAGRTGSPPRSLRELVAAGDLSSVPVDPDGRSYEYDPGRGKVMPPAARVLGGS